MSLALDAPQPGPAQLGPAQPGPAQPGATQPGATQPGPARRGLSGMVAASALRRRKLSSRAFARRARAILWLKRVLPAAALVLLSLILLWPEIRRVTQAENSALKRFSGRATLSGELLDAHYRGVDGRGQAYTVTARSGRQITQDLVALTDPRADSILSGGQWVMLQADHGVYAQHSQVLDLWGHVVLYRDDGITVRSSRATMDLKTGFAAGQHVVSAEGPFGTLDATGFAVGDRGGMAQFTGPARLVLNARNR